MFSTRLVLSSLLLAGVGVLADGGGKVDNVTEPARFGAAKAQGIKNDWLRLHRFFFKLAPALDPGIF